jgi:hypothetical protein
MKTPPSLESTPSAMPHRDFLILSTVSAGALSTVGIKNGKPFLDVVSGSIEVREIRMG